MARIIEAFVYNLIQQVTQEKISMSKMTELLNEEACRITTNKECDRLTHEIYNLEEQPNKDHEDEKRLKLLGKVISEYEEKNYKLPPPTAEDIKQFNKEQLGK